MNKTILLLAFILLFVATKSFAQIDDSDKVVGTWLTEDKDGKVEIFKAGDKYFGKLVWGDKMYAADGKTSLKDDKNPDTTLRNRDRKDLVMMTGFTYDNGEWTGGKIYDMTTGKTYNASMKLKDDKLNVRGYLGIPLFGKTIVWTRVE